MSKIESVTITITIHNCYKCPHCDRNSRDVDLCKEAWKKYAGRFYDYQTPSDGIADWCPKKSKYNPSVPDRMV